MVSRLDRPVLVSNLVSGALWLVPVAVGSPPLASIGLGYVVLASVFLARAYAGPLTRGQEAAVWAAPWLAAAALWTVLIAGTGPVSSPSDLLLVSWIGLVVGTGCYLGWQLLALAVRQLLAWRAGPSA